MEKYFNKVFIGFGVVFASLSFFSAGLDAHKGFYNDSVYSVVGAIFWIFVIFLLAKMDRASEKLDRELDKSTQELNHAMREFGGAMDKMFDEIKEEQHAREMLEAVSRDIIGKRKPKASDGAKIEKAFHENMEDHWCKLTFDKKSGKFDVVIQKQPFETAKPAAKKAPAKKPLTKSQERRIAATKKAGK